MTDGGIEALCGGATGEEENKLQGGKGQCKSIHELFVANIKITQKGLQTSFVHAVTDAHHYYHQCLQQQVPFTTHVTQERYVSFLKDNFFLTC